MCCLIVAHILDNSTSLILAHTLSVAHSLMVEYTQITAHALMVAKTWINSVFIVPNANNDITITSLHDKDQRQREETSKAISTSSQNNTISQQ